MENGSIQFFSVIRGYAFKGDIHKRACMESKHLIIAGIWIAVIVMIIGFFATGVNLEFFGYLILLFLAYAFSLITEFLLTRK